VSIVVEGVKSRLRICANDLCMVAFTPSRHNQKYCSKECCKVVTNAKIMQQYYEEKDRKSGIPRTCKTCKVSRLSRYNEGTVCAPCRAKEETVNRLTLLSALGIA
jgi:hypothetical protein